MSAMPFGGGSRWRLHRRDGEADACLGEAHAHLEAHRRDAARSAVRRALRADLNLAESLEAARLLHVLDETQAAVDLYHALLRDAGDEPSSLTVRAALLMVLGRYEEAVAPLRALVGQCPDDPEGHLQLAQALARTGDRKGAIASARQARRVAPPWPDLHLVVGRLMLRLDAQIEARAALEAAHRMDPEDATLTLTIGRTWARAGAYAEALTMFEAVLERHPGSLDGLVEAGLTYARLGRREDTARCQQILERLHPGRPDARRRLENALAESTHGQRRQPPPLPALPAATGNREEVADEAILEVSDDASADVPPGLSSVVPAPGDRQGFSGVTTGEVEAALGTLDLVIDDSLGAWSDIANGSIEVALLPPPLRLEEATGSPAPRTPSVPPPLASAPPAPGPAVVHAPEADDDSLTGDSFDEAFEALFAAVPPAESDRVASDLDSEAVTRTTASSVSSMDDLPMTAALDDEDDSVDVGYGGSGEALIEPEESEAPVPAPAPEDDPPPALLPGGSRRAEADPFDAPPPLVADIGVDRGPVHSARPDARAELPESLRSGSFALLAPPHPRPASPPLTPVAEDALPPLLDFASMSGDPGGEDDVDARRPATPPVSRMGTGGIPVVRTPTGAMAAVRTADGPPPRVVRPTGALPDLPPRKRFAEIAIERGLTHPGMAIADARRRGTGPLNEPLPGRPTPAAAARAARAAAQSNAPRPATPATPAPAAQPALVPTGWGAAPRTDPLLTTSDALQRWRPPGQTDEPKEESIDDMVPANVERGPKSTALVAGSLGLFWVPRLLRFMEAARLTGCLSLNSLHGTGEVSFRSGRLTGATASNRASLATVLQQGDRLRPEQRARLGDTAWAQDNGEALLDRLIDAGLFDAPNVNAAVIDQVFETVDELLRWNAGWFTLRTQAEPPMPPGRRPARLPLAALLSGVEDAREVEPTMVGAKMRAPRIEGSTRDPRLEARIRAQRQHLERTPTDVRARLRLGQLLMRAEDFVEAAGELLNGLTTSTDPRLIKLLGAAIDGLAQAGPRRGSEQVLSVGLCGRLGRINLVQLLEMAAQERITGAFRLIAPEGLAEIRLVDGLLTGATNTNTARLGDVIRASGLVSGEQVEQLVERQHQRNRWTPLGRLAIEAGFLTPERLRDLLQKQMRLALLESGRWRRAHFTFEVADRQLAGDPQRDLDADTILRDLRRMVAPTR